MTYDRVNWENLPSEDTPLDADNLNIMDEGIAAANAFADRLWLPTVGEDTYPRYATFSSAGVTLTSQALRLTYHRAVRTETCNFISTFTAGTAAGATPTLCKMGVYEVDESDGDLTLVAYTANSTAMWGSTGTQYKTALNTPFAKVRGALYAYAALCDTGATAPVISGMTLNSAPLATDVPPRVNALRTSRTDLPASISYGDLSTHTAIPYFYLSPA